MRKIYLSTIISLVLHSPLGIANSMPELTQTTPSNSENSVNNSVNFLTPSNHQIFSLGDLIPIHIDSHQIHPSRAFNVTVYYDDYEENYYLTYPFSFHISPYETGVVRLVVTEQGNTDLYQQVQFRVVEDLDGSNKIQPEFTSPQEGQIFRLGQPIDFRLNILGGFNRRFNVTVIDDAENKAQFNISRDSPSFTYTPETEGRYKVDYEEVGRPDYSGPGVVFHVEAAEEPEPPQFVYEAARILSPRSGEHYEFGKSILFELFANVDEKARHFNIEINGEPSFQVSSTQPYTTFVPKKPGKQIITVSEPAHSELGTATLEFYANKYEPQIDPTAEVELEVKEREFFKIGETVTLEASAEGDFDEILFFINGQLQKRLREAPFLFEFIPSQADNYVFHVEAHKEGDLRDGSQEKIINVVREDFFNYCMAQPEWQTDVAYQIKDYVRVGHKFYLASEQSTGLMPSKHPNVWSKATCSQVANTSTIKVIPEFEKKNYQVGEDVEITFDFEVPKGVELKSLTLTENFKETELEAPWVYRYQFKGTSQVNFRPADLFSAVATNSLDITNLTQFEISGEAIPKIGFGLLTQEGVSKSPLAADVKTKFQTFVSGIDGKDESKAYSLVLFHGEEKISEEKVVVDDEESETKFVYFEGTFEKGPHEFTLVLMEDSKEIVKMTQNVVFEEIPNQFDYMYEFPNSLLSYRSGTTVAHNGETFRCRDGAWGGFCSQWSIYVTPFEPGVGRNWTMAWEHLGKAGKQVSD